MTSTTAARAWSLGLLLAFAALAGCAEPAAPAATTPPTVAILADRPDTAFGKVATGPAAGPDVDATTALAPRLVEGEWWRIQFKGGVFEDLDVPELVRVVAAIRCGDGASRGCGVSDADVPPTGYVFGMPHEGWFKEAIAFHAPAFGDVGPDLSYDVHNVRFEPLRFPLVEGATWQTAFGGSDYTASVESADERTATIRYDPPPSSPQPTDPVYGALAMLGPIPASGVMRMVYDARQHEVVRFEAAFGSWEVVEHGYGFEGWVTVPRAAHTAIDYGQFLPATPGEPVVTRSASLQGGFNRLTILHAIVAFGPGAYRIRDVSPNGTEYVTESVGGAGLTVRFYEASDPDGEWTLEDVVGGAGATYTMGMAYHQHDVRLPDGAIRTDHSHPTIR